MFSWCPASVKHYSINTYNHKNMWWKIPKSLMAICSRSRRKTQIGPVSPVTDIWCSSANIKAKRYDTLMSLWYINYLFNKEPSKIFHDHFCNYSWDLLALSSAIWTSLWICYYFLELIKRRRWQMLKICLNWMLPSHPWVFSQSLRGHYIE